MAENDLMKQAREAVKGLFNQQDNNKTVSEEEKQTAQNVIQSAYASSTPQEKQELEELEEQLRQNDHIR